MRIEPRTFTESNVNPRGYREVVVEGYTPEEVTPVLPNCFLVFQNTEEDYEGVFCCSQGVLNALKPNLFVCDNPSEGDVKLCKSFNCEVVTLEELKSLVEPELKINVLQDLENLDVFSLADGEVSESLSDSFEKTIEEPKNYFGTYNGKALNPFN